MLKQRRYPWRISSLKQLVLLSFLAVVSPFAVLIYYASDALVTQSAQGRILAKQALEVTRRGQQLEHLAEDITRSIRQFEIVAKPEIKQRLDQLLDDYRQQLSIHGFLLSERQQYDEISALLKQIATAELPEVGSLLPMTRSLNQQIDQILDQRLQALNETAQTTQTRLSSIAMVLLAIEALLILYFSLRITRPVKHIAARIRAMGTGQDYQSAQINGPDELVDLDQQLNWLTQRLAEVEEEKQRFLRHMSHELKTPLTTLREGSDLLADQIIGELNKSQMEVTQLLQNNARQLQTLIEQLLDYSRLSQHEPVNRQTTLITPLIHEALEPYKLLLEQKHIRVFQPDSAIAIHTDRAMLLRILGNLISNAALYGADNGRLDITVEQQLNQLCIEVGNKGPTIPTVDIPQLFEPFYQGRNRRKGPVKGSGIGLSIVRDAADSIDAQVNLARNERNYVSFSVHLPMSEPPTEDSPIKGQPHA